MASATSILWCHAKHNHKEASKVKSDDAKGLEQELLLAEGENVMLLDYCLSPSTMHSCFDPGLF